MMGKIVLLMVALLTGIAIGTTCATTARAQDDETWTEPTTNMEFVRIPAGCFQMGSMQGQDDERPVHEVCVDEFWMGRFEVTQAQWLILMGVNPSRFKDNRHPVEKVSWDRVQEFIKQLNAKGNGVFRLPTEAEWEYAARSGGKDEKYAGSNEIDRVAWYDATARSTTHPVGAKAPNGLGLHDMSGNVAEWCQGIYSSTAYEQGAAGVRVSPGDVVYRAVRGGSWNDEALFVRTTARSMAEPDFPSDAVGFRLVRTP